MAITSFEADERTAALIIQLRETFRVNINVAVIRKALALGNVASQHIDSDHTITVAPGGGKPRVKVSLAE